MVAKYTEAFEVFLGDLDKIAPKLTEAENQGIRKSAHAMLQVFSENAERFPRV